MLGWMILFAFMAILGALLRLANPASTSSLMGLTFGLLFFAGLVTRLVRGRAW